MYLSLIIPAYNEAARLPETLALVRDWVERHPDECADKIEVIVVSDGSTDATAEVVEEFQKRFPPLRLINNKHNQGKGGAVKDGMLAATGDWRLFMDADGSTPITELDKLLAKIPGGREFCDEEHQNHKDLPKLIFIGSRYLNENSIKVKQPLKRRIASRAVNSLIQVMVLRGIRDTQCGFKLFSAPAAEVVFNKLNTKGWLFDVELLTIARANQIEIHEVAVDWYDAKQSKLRALKTGKTVMRELLSIVKRSKTGQYKV